ncbi:MAG: tetratricopeptide repeat protein [candidate division WOR-3 bacterium]|nr:MAG: tetratricopeptide repeat protein [candidate division WOR-3 bacterium]
MDPITLILTIVGIIVAIIFGYLQVIVPFTKKEVKFAKRFPFVVGAEAAAEKIKPRPKRAAEGFQKLKSIVVLPLENVGQPEDEYFAVGITEEITSRLALVSGLGVTSRTSANQYAKTNKTVRQIGDELGVQYVLEGTVRWARAPKGTDRVRITPQLIRVSDDTHLWAQSYDRVLDDIFEIQSEIAQNVVDQLGVKILEPERRAVDARPTDNLEAYQAYLRARYFATRPHFSVDNWEKAIECAQRAVELDPDFVQAYVQLTKAHSVFYYYWYDHSEERKIMAKQAADQALALAPDSPHVHLALAYYHLWCYRDPKCALRALRELERAEKGLPNSAELFEAKADVFQLQGYWDKALEAYKKAFELNPRDASLPTSIAQTLLVTRRYVQALETCDQAIALAPDQVWPYFYKTFIYWCWNGDLKKASAVLKGAPKKHVWMPWVWYWQEMFQGKYREAIERLSLTDGDWIRIKIGARPKSLFSAYAYELLNEPHNARTNYETAKTMLEAEVKKHPDDPRYHSSLGIAYAALDQKTKAIKEGMQAVKLLPISKDAFYGIPYVQDLARIYTIVGEYDKALDQLEYLLSIPSWLSVSWVKVDPRWNPVRELPRFQKLLKKYS